MEDQLYVQIEEEKKSKFKSKCADLDISLKDVINAAVDDFLENDGKPKWLKK